MNNNRRQFIKKSFIAGLLGIFAPSIIGKQIEPRKIAETTTNSKVYYFDAQHEFQKFRDNNFYYKFYKGENWCSLVVTDDGDYFWADERIPDGINIEFVRIKNYLIYMHKDHIKVKIIFNYK